jgi:phosphatidylinositol alpha-1,6-mannosyltransferase
VTDPADPPSVLLISPVYPPARGGIETLCRELVRHSAARWSVLTLDEPGSDTVDDAPATAVRRVLNRPRGGRRSLARLTAAAATSVPARLPRPDVVVSMEVRCAPAAWLVGRRYGARWVQYFHAKEVPAYPRLSRFAVTRADACVAVSHYTVGLVRRITGHGADRVLRIPPGVPAPPPGPGPAGPLRDPRPTVLTISRMAHAYKGHDVLLDAVCSLRARIPDLQWVVIGDGELRPRLEHDAARRGLTGAARFLGIVTDQVRDDWLRRSHVFALPSRTPPDGRGGEGFGIVYLEAARHGLPVVAGRAGGVPDAVLHGRTGLLVSPEDPGQVADAIGRVLTEPGLAGRLGGAGRTFAAGHAWPAIAARTDDLLWRLRGCSGT